jgi:hypothetical protein
MDVLYGCIDDVDAAGVEDQNDDPVAAYMGYNI